MQLNKSYVSIEFRDDVLVAVEFTYSFKKFILQSYNRKNLEPGIIEGGVIKNEEKLTESIKDLLGNAWPKPIAATDCIVIINDKQVFHHTFEVSSDLSDKELYSVIPIEAENIIPFKKDEIYWDYSSYKDPSDEKKLRVQYSTIQKQSVDSYVKVLESVGFDVNILTSHIEVYKEVLYDLPKEASKVLVIEIDYDNTYLLFFDNNVLQKTKTVNRGVKSYVRDLATNNNLDAASVVNLLTSKKEGKLDLGDQSNFFEEFAADLQEGIEDIVDIKAMDKIFIWGNGLRIPNLFSFLAENLDPRLEVKVIWQPITLSKEIESNSKIIAFINQDIINFGLAVGAAFNFVNLSNGFRIHNLLPFERRRQVGNRMIMSFLGRIGFLVILLSFGIIFFMGYFVTSFKYELKRLDSETRNFEELIYGERYFQIKEEILNLNQEIDDLYNLTSSIQNVPGSFYKILNLNIDTINIKNIFYNRDKNMITVRGVADNRKELLEFRDEIEKIANVDNIDLPLSNFDVGENILFDIKIQLNLENKKDESL